MLIYLVMAAAAAAARAPARAIVWIFDLTLTWTPRSRGYCWWPAVYGPPDTWYTW